MISLVIPTLNEVENVSPLLARIAQCSPAPDQIIFVDDGSTDGTPARIRSLAGAMPVELIERDAPSLGLAGAVIAGARAAAAFAFPLTGVHDSMCGFFAMPRKLLLELTPGATGFKIAFEVLVQGGRNLRVVEIPIVFRDRSLGVSKMSFGVASVFVVRWLAAMAKKLFRDQETAPRFSRQSSIASPAKSSKVANSAFP